MWDFKKCLELCFELYGKGNVFKRKEAMQEAYSVYLKRGGIPLTGGVRMAEEKAYYGFKDTTNIPGIPRLVKVNSGTKNGLWIFGPSVKEPPQQHLLDMNYEHVLCWRKFCARRLRQLREVAKRTGQGRFHTHVLANFMGCCCVTGLSNDVDAAHIISYSDGGDMHSSNGLALHKSIHSAYDTGLFTIDPSTLTILVKQEVRNWLAIHGIQISDGRIWQINRAALARHYDAFISNN